MTLPMQDLLVLDLTQIYNGPYATYLMALAGATILKIEPPGGESLRRRGAVGGAGLPFAMLNGCKESLVLDLKSDEGKAALLALAAKADVIVENFAPGAMDRLGLGAEVLQKLNPKLIYASSSGYGRDGPYRAYPAMDLTIQAMSGALFVTGYPDRAPVKNGPAIADFFAGIHLYGAIATALYERERFGVARRLELAMQDAIYASLSSNLGMHWFNGGAGDVPARTGNRHGGLAECPYNVYETRDGHIALICVGDAHWRALCGVIGQPDVALRPEFLTLKQRVAHMDDVDAFITEWTRQHDTQAIFDLLMTAKIPCSPVRDLDAVMNDENMFARGTLTKIEHPEFGTLTVQRSPMRYDGVPDRELEPSQKLGASTERVLKAYTDLDAETIARVIASGSPASS